MKFEIPKPLQVEHEELHARLVEATRQPGAVGEAAREVARLLHPHFVREEEFALPPLALLEKLARARATAEMAGVLPMTRRLKAELPQMLAEHKQIVGALGKLRDAARVAPGWGAPLARPSTYSGRRERQPNGGAASLVARALRGEHEWGCRATGPAPV